MDIFPNELPERIEEVLAACGTLEEIVDVLSKPDPSRACTEPIVFFSLEDDLPSFSPVMKVCSGVFFPCCIYIHAVVTSILIY